MIQWTSSSSCPPSSLTPIIFPFPLLWGSLITEEGDSMQMFNLDSVCKCLTVVFYIHSLLLPEKASLMTTGQGTIHEYGWQNMKNHFIGFLFSFFQFPSLPFFLLSFPFPLVGGRVLTKWPKKAKNEPPAPPSPLLPRPLFLSAHPSIYSMKQKDRHLPQ